MFELFGRMMLLPVTVFVSATREMLSSLEPCLPAGSGLGVGAEPAASGERRSTNDAGPPLAAPHSDCKEEIKVADTHLGDDTVKLVEYSIITVKRSRGGDGEGVTGERELHSDRRVVTENLTEDAFVTWVVAEFLQNGGKSLSDEDRRHLRVYFNVLKRWPREDLRYEEDQLAELRGIRKAIHAIADAKSGTGKKG